MRGEIAETYFNIIAEEASLATVDATYNNLILVKKLSLDESSFLTGLLVTEVGKIKKELPSEIKELLLLVIKLNLLQGENVQNLIADLFELSFTPNVMRNLTSGLTLLAQSDSLQKNLQLLYPQGILRILIKHKEPHNLVSLFNELNVNQILEQLSDKTRDCAIEHLRLANLVHSLRDLKKQSLDAFVQPLLFHLCRHPYPERVFRSLSILFSNNLFTGTYINLCTNNTDLSISTTLANTLTWLKMKNLLGSEQEKNIINAIQEYEQPADFAHAIFQLASVMSEPYFPADLLDNLTKCSKTPVIASLLNAIACRERLLLSPHLAKIILFELTQKNSLNEIEAAIDCLDVLNNRKLLESDSAEYFIRESLKYTAKNNSLTSALDTLGPLGFYRSNLRYLILKVSLTMRY